MDQSVARRACLNEESYPIRCGSASLNIVRKSTMLSQDKGLPTSQCVLSHDGMEQESESAWYAQTTLPDLDAAVSHNMLCTLHNATTCTKEDGGPVVSEPTIDPALDDSVANDSQTEDNDMYLSDCKILIAGFNASDMRKLVNMVRRGGGSRYMCLSEKLTHIIVGTPSDVETKQIRNLAALGIIYVVKAEWLEDCNKAKKEVSILRRHIAYDLLLPKDPICLNKRFMMDANGMNEGRSHLQPTLSDDHILRSNSGCGTLLEKRKEAEVTMDNEISLEKPGHLGKKQRSCAFDVKGDLKMRKSSSHEIEKKSLTFDGKLFCFSGSFPANQRAEIVEWVNQGGGKFVENEVGANIQFIVESHGVVPPETRFSMSKYVSSHWIRSCLMDGCLMDVNSHILYSPLPCQVPFIGFKSYIFCVSQYDEKERLLLRNLCFILGVKFVEKLTKKVTHLLCKFSNGPKYEAACKWGIQAVTSEWIYECVKQNKVVVPGPFFPKEVTTQDREGGVCTTTQYPTQACRMISGDVASQLPSQSQDFNDTSRRKIAARLDPKNSNNCNRRSRTSDTDLSSHLSLTESIHQISPTKHNGIENAKESSSILPDVAAAIEDLLEQTSKIHDQKSPDQSTCEKSLFSTDSTIISQDHRVPQSALALPKHWTNRFDREDDCKPLGDATTGIHENLSETQTESQVVIYAEDLSGRQMIIDRVRTKNSMI